MFSRKISHHQKETPGKSTPPLVKRSSLMCLPENRPQPARNPSSRFKLSNDKKALSLECLRPDEKFAEGTKVESNVKEWSLSFTKLLSDEEGIETFKRYLEKEHSAENIRFWIQCEDYKKTRLSELSGKAREIYDEYLCGSGLNQVNIDSCRLKEIRGELDKPHAWTFERAQQDIFLLMKRDSYPRFLKSREYTSILNGS